MLLNLRYNNIGTLGPDAVLGTKLGGSIPADHAGPALKTVIDFYTENKQSAESFASFVKRTGVGVFEEKLNGFLGVESNTYHDDGQNLV